MRIVDYLKPLKATLIYAGAETVSKGLNWLLLFILFFLSKENPADYGLLAILVAFERIVSVVIDFGQKRIIYRFFDSHSEANNEFLSVTLSVWMLVTVTVLGLFYTGMIIGQVNEFFKIPVDALFVLFLFFLVLQNIYSFVCYYYRISKRINYYSRHILTYNVSRFVIVLTLSLLFHQIVGAYVWGCLLAVVIAIASSLNLFRQIRFRFVIHKGILVRNMTYGYPLVIQQLISNLGPNIDKFFLTYFVSLAEIGIYNFVVTLTSAFAFLFSIGTSYFEPMLFRVREDEKLFLSINNSFLHICFFFSSLTILLTVLALEFFGVEQVRLYLIIAVAYMQLPLYFSNTYVYMTRDKNLYVVLFSAVAVVAVVLGDYFLIRWLGVDGAAYAQLLYVFVLGWCSYAFMIRKFPNQRFRLNEWIGYITLPVMLLSCVLGIPMLLVVCCFVVLIFSSYFIMKNKRMVYSVLKGAC